VSGKKSLIEDPLPLLVPMLDSGFTNTHPDVLAQEKGLLPAALCAWNAVSSEDISSFPVDFGSRGFKS
jgi:hypothetical protein